MINIYWTCFDFIASLCCIFFLEKAEKNAAEEEKFVGRGDQTKEEEETSTERMTNSVLCTLNLYT